MKQNKIVKIGSLYLFFIVLLTNITFASPIITVSKPFVEIREYSSDVDSFTINITGFQSNENVTLKVEVDENMVVNESGDSQFTIQTDANGKGDIILKPKLDSYSGRAVITATSSTTSITLDTNKMVEENGLTIERLKRTQGTANGHSVYFKLYYTNQTINNVPSGDRIEIMDLLNAVKNSYETQAGTWGFNKHLGNEYDPNNTIKIYVNDIFVW